MGFLDIGLALAGLATYSVAVEPQWIRGVEYTVRIKGLAPPFSGLTILHLSDLHGRVEVFLSPKFRTWFARCDMIVITGDLYALSLPRRRLAQALDQLRAPLGVWYVSGNHDYRQGRLAVAPWRPGTRNLDNRAVAIERNGARMWLAGLPDLVKGRPDWPGLRDRLNHVDEPVILLAHRPDAALLPGAERAALVLSGHTHGGQVTIPGIGAVFKHNRLPGRYAGGPWYGPGGPVVITSRGLGTSELPVRLGARPELVRIRLYP